MSRLLVRYREEVAPELMKKFGMQNKLQVPRLHKIVLNMGVGSAAQDQKMLEDAVKDLMQIAGQAPVMTAARKSISNFKIRAGLKIGCKVTLRGKRMYEFFDRLVNVVLPRIKDFRGVPLRSFDGRGNYTLGISEQSVFPELDIDRLKVIQGMDISFITTAQTDEEARELLTLLGMPFEKK
jgi:large subunit ribosomal protein L5